jgi:hypothetical protein
MSGSAPGDLSVMFRAVPRRLRDAQGDLPSDAIGSQISTIDRLLSDAAGLVHSAAEPSAIADAIDALPAKEWNDHLLAGVRSIALELGGVLRQLAAANPDADN